jgi:hypothetical protein
MDRKWLGIAVLSASVVSGSPLAHAQEVVHAVTGTVTAVDPAKNTIDIKTNDDSLGEFHYQKQLKSPIEFDKSVREGTTEPDSFNKIGDHVVAYYFQGPSGRVIVALKDFGATPLQVATGTLVKSPKHHEFSVKTTTGAVETFQIAKDASAETPEGVSGGLKFEADSGTPITVRYTEDGGAKVAQFIRTD